MELSDVLIDLALELMERLPKGEVIKVGTSWCYIIDDVLYTSLGSKDDLIGISKGRVGIAGSADGNADHLIPAEIRLPLMDVIEKLNVFVVPA